MLKPGSRRDRNPDSQDVREVAVSDLQIARVVVGWWLPCTYMVRRRPPSGFVIPMTVAQIGSAPVIVVALSLGRGQGEGADGGLGGCSVIAAQAQRTSFREGSVVRTPPNPDAASLGSLLVLFFRHWVALCVLPTHLK